MKSAIFILMLIFAKIVIASDNIKILIITGGHAFEREPFYHMFTDMAKVDWDSLSHPNANAVYGSPPAKEYDVLVFYDMNQDITAEQKQAFLDMVKKGKGLLFLHHSLASYQEWDEFLQVLGGRYWLKPEDKSKASTFEHDLDIPVQIVAADHPVTRSLKDFVIHDEAYGNFQVLPQVTPLLKTRHPKSGEIIGWANSYGTSRIVYLQLGHDHYAYENGNYRRLVRNAIFWVAGKTGLSMHK